MNWYLHFKGVFSSPKVPQEMAGIPCKFMCFREKWKANALADMDFSGSPKIVFCRVTVIFKVTDSRKWGGGARPFLATKQSNTGQ